MEYPKVLWDELRNFSNIAGCIKKCSTGVWNILATEWQDTNILQFHLHTGTYVRTIISPHAPYTYVHTIRPKRRFASTRTMVLSSTHVWSFARCFLGLLDPSVWDRQATRNVGKQLLHTPCNIPEKRNPLIDFVCLFVCLSVSLTDLQSKVSIENLIVAQLACRTRRFVTVLAVTKSASCPEPHGSRPYPHTPSL
jgi:hypothetical protein